MSDIEQVQLWLWTDHNRGYMEKWQILATDYWVLCVTNAIAICLTLVFPCIVKIFWSSVRCLASIWSNLSRRESTVLGSADGEMQHLLGSQLRSDDNQQGSAVAPENESVQQIEDSRTRAPVISEKKTPREILFSQSDASEKAWEMLHYLRHSEGNLPQILTGFILIIIVIGIFVALTVAGIFSAKIASDSVALSSSINCGIWEFNDKQAGTEANYRDDLYNYKKEARASQYARNCYNLSDSFGCNFFYNQSIAYKTSSRQMCPFKSPDLCLNGLYSAVTFDTGLVDASVIGINSPATHKFRRTTSCSPLNMTERYVQKISTDHNDTEYCYYYGQKIDTNFTFNTSGDPFQWLVPVYSMKTYFSSLYPRDDYWQPLPELKPSNKDGTLTIMFISSMHIYHVKPSFDPLFPATTPRYFPDEHYPYYYNADPRARPFACVDTSELCSPSGETCWSMKTPLPTDSPNTTAYWLMKWSLENSNTYESIKWRLGSALLAQESVSQSVSIPLPENQWEIEARQLFATSLARIQYDAWGIARGEGRGQPGYIEVTPDEGRDKLCSFYKFRSTGYTNMNLIGLISLPLMALVIFILSLDVSSLPSCLRQSGAGVAVEPNGDEGGAGASSHSLQSRPDRKQETSLKPLVVEIVAISTWRMLIDIVKCAWWLLKLPVRALQRYQASRRRRHQADD